MLSAKMLLQLIVITEILVHYAALLTDMTLLMSTATVLIQFIGGVKVLLAELTEWMSISQMVL